MTSGTVFRINFIYLLFLLIPGYIGLRVYHKAHVKLDNHSRTDKLLLSALLGLITVGVIVAAYHLTPLRWTLSSVDSFITTNRYTAQRELLFSSNDRLFLSDTSSLSLEALLAILSCQIVIAVFLGGGYGKLMYRWEHRSVNGEPRSQNDLEQPWETAVQKSDKWDDVTVITKQNHEINGKILRVGSPSENFDLLLAFAKKIIRDKQNEVDEEVPLGVTYHHYRDISQVHFTGIRLPDPPSESDSLRRRAVLSADRIFSMVSRGLENDGDADGEDDNSSKGEDDNQANEDQKRVEA